MVLKKRGVKTNKNNWIEKEKKKKFSYPISTRKAKNFSSSCTSLIASTRSFSTKKVPTSKAVKHFRRGQEKRPGRRAPILLAVTHLLAPVRQSDRDGLASEVGLNPGPDMHSETLFLYDVRNNILCLLLLDTELMLLATYAGSIHQKKKTATNEQAYCVWFSLLNPKELSLQTASYLRNY